ncbi:MAG: AraC family transcriptional regulator, partial [Rhizobacter sp.]
CSRSAMRPLLETLPRLVRIPGGDGQAALLLRELLSMGAREAMAARPGVDSTLARLADLMFVDALRRYAENLPPEGRSWLSALRDARIGRALALMHAEPGRAWTLDELARKVALSRSALADRFASLVGEPPMQYLTRWRLALAARSLRSGEAIVRVAERSGYESDAAFGRAFKREFGMPPAKWRRHARVPSPPYSCSTGTNGDKSHDLMRSHGVESGSSVSTTSLSPSLLIHCKPLPVGLSRTR